MKALSLLLYFAISSSSGTIAVVGLRYQNITIAVSALVLTIVVASWGAIRALRTPSVTLDAAIYALLFLGEIAASFSILIGLGGLAWLS